MMLLAETAAEARSSNSLSPAVCRASLKQQHRVFVPSSLSLFAAFHCQKVLSSSCPSYDREKELKAYCYRIKNRELKDGQKLRIFGANKNSSLVSMLLILVRREN